MSRGGYRPGSGRKATGDPTRSLSISPRRSEYAILKAAAEQAGKTFSRFVVDAAMEKAAAMRRQT